MIFHIQAIDDNDEHVARIITSNPSVAWDALQAYLQDSKIAFLSLQYWYDSGKMRSNYAIDKKRGAAWLFDGEPTPTILKGITHYFGGGK